MFWLLITIESLFCRPNSMKFFNKRFNQGVLGVFIMLALFILWWKTFAAPASHLLISEVQYAPLTGTSLWERFEFFNPTSGSINIAGWTIEEEHGWPRYYTFPANTIITAGSYFVVTNSWAVFWSNNPWYPYNIDMMAGTGCSTVNSSYCLQLNNTWSPTSAHVDRLLLKDGSGNSVDEVRRWDYAYTTASTNRSICRITSDDTDSVGDWQSNCALTPWTGIAWIPLIFSPYIILNWFGIVNIPLGSIYVDSGARFVDTRWSWNVTTTGIVDTGHIGANTLFFSHTDLSGNIATNQRTVNIIDTIPPTVTLLWSGSVTVPLGSTYVDSGAIRNDNVDGSWSSLVGRRGSLWSFTSSGNVNTNAVGLYAVQYLKVDSWWNYSTIATRIVQVADQTAPTIALVGNSTVSIYQTQSYSDSGAIRNDNVDGSWTITGVSSGATLDTNVAGTYYLSYTHTDLAGNIGNTVTRAIVVQPVSTGGIVISEVQYDTLQENEWEWFELYNPTSWSIDISLRTIEEEQPAGTPNKYTFPITTIIPARGYFVVTNSGAVFSSENSGKIADLSMIWWSWCNNTSPSWCLRLNNISYSSHVDYLLLKNPLWNSVDEVRRWDYAYTSPSNTNNKSICHTFLTGMSLADQRQTNCIPTPWAKFYPYIHMSWSSYSTLPVWYSFTDPGANFVEARNTGAATVSGSVNTSIPWTYILEYTYTDADSTPAVPMQRTVKITDQNAPSVNLYGDANIYISLWAAYIDSGAWWIDNVDWSWEVLTWIRGETWSFAISGLVDTNTFWTYTIEYMKVDSAGNMSDSIARIINVVDQEAPIITLNWDATITLLQGSTFTDSWATWTDNVDGAWAIPTATHGAVDTNLPGTYYLTYSYTDAAGNTGTETRTVIIQAKVTAVDFAGGGRGASTSLTSTTASEPKSSGNSSLSLYNPSLAKFCGIKNDLSTIYQWNKVSDLFRTAHQRMFSYGLTRRQGTVDYRPFDTLTREEAAKITLTFAKDVLCRTPLKTYNGNFSDIDTADASLQQSIKESYEYGIFQWDNGGKTTTFRPLARISKDEFAAILTRLVANKSLSENWIDWAAHYRAYIEAHTKDTSLSTLTRENIAEVLYDLYRNNSYIEEAAWYRIE